MALLPVLIFLPMAMALVAILAGRCSHGLRDGLVSLTGAVVFGLCVLVAFQGGGSYEIPAFCGFGLTLKADGFRALYACVAAFMWMMTGFFTPDYMSHGHARTRYSFFNLMTLGATLGVFLSDDLYTTFIFFEIMSFTSYVWVAQEETPGALKAAGTYLAVAVIGGLTTLMGLFLLYFHLGTLSFDGLQAAMAAAGNQPVLTVATWLTLVGFAGKAGMFPVHIWLPKAHPVAPAPASALLSGILTKSGIFGLIVICSRLMPGNEAFGNALLILASITMFLGALLALFSVDLKRTLACSSMSQVGFIAVGLSMMVLLGEHGSLAAYGTVMHMANHSLIKLVLFMCAGVVYMNAHALDLNEIRGFGRKKPLLHIAFFLGATSIACIPPIGSGYNSKSLLHEAILELIVHNQEHGHIWMPYKAAEILFLISGGLTVAYMIKLYICIFWQKNPTRQEEFDAQKGYMKPLSAAAILLSAAVLPVLGALPEKTLGFLGDQSAHFFGQHEVGHAIPYFSAANLEGAAISIGIGLAVYLLVCRPLLMRKTEGGREYVNRWPARLDLEELLYRPLLMKWLPGAADLVVGTLARLPDSKLVKVVIPACVTGVIRFFAELPERLVMLGRNTLFNKRRAHQPIPVGTPVTYAVGKALNGLAGFLNRTILRRRPMRTDFEVLLAASWHELKEDTRTLTVSVSFGLLLLCVGLFLTCLYLLR
ncbi:MAG: sodium:proton antiporter [Clostridia bacterium]|nr:sodium:proton antiporter [Clostridia bacterium]